MRIVVFILIVVAAAAMLARGAESATAPTNVAASQPAPLSIVWSELRTSSVLLLETHRLEYTVQVAGRLYLPNDADLMGAAALLEVTEATDPDGRDLLAAQKGGAVGGGGAATRPAHPGAHVFDRLQPSFVVSSRPTFVPVYAPLSRLPHNPQSVKRLAGQAHLLYATEKKNQELDVAPTADWSELGGGLKFKIERIDKAERPGAAGAPGGAAPTGGTGGTGGPGGEPIVVTLLFDRPLTSANSLDLYMPPTILEITMTDDAGKPVPRRTMLLNIRTERSAAPVGMVNATFVPGRTQKPAKLVITGAIKGEERGVPFVLKDLVLP